MPDEINGEIEGVMEQPAPDEANTKLRVPGLKGSYFSERDEHSNLYWRHIILELDRSIHGSHPKLVSLGDPVHVNGKTVWELRLEDGQPAGTGFCWFRFSAHEYGSPRRELSQQFVYVRFKGTRSQVVQHQEPDNWAPYCLKTLG